jgi:hypothetical protein
VTEVLTQRGLNRATLARQYLLGRAPVRAIDTIEHLGGMQSQAPLAPYVGLWTRLQNFAPAELAELTQTRQVVRLHLMRNTVHLVSARDCLDWCALFHQLRAAQFRAHFRSSLDAVDTGALIDHAKRLLAEQPRTRAELGRLLAEYWPDTDPGTLAFAATHHIALCQVTPRGIWGKHGPAAGAPVESWLGAPLRSVPVDALVLRYLGAFGPARPPSCRSSSPPGRPATSSSANRRSLAGSPAARGHPPRANREATVHRVFEWVAVRRPASYG